MRSVMAVLLLVLGCREAVTPLDPEAAPSRGALVTQGVSDPAARHQRLARRLALALADDAFRGDVRRALEESPDREGKVLLQRFLGVRGSFGRQRLAALSGDLEQDIDLDLDAAAPIELYLPVPAHRRSWSGGADLLVATAEQDEDAPVAFDTRGKRLVLSAATPPATPVLALGRAERVFPEAEMSFYTCFTACEDGPGTGGSGDPGASLTTTPGLYMTYASFNQTFEGWLKGSPEFEVHILGQDGSSTAMKSYQCAGAEAGVPYQYDQNDKQWSGRVMLFSQTQLDAFKAAHPDHSVRVFLLEDDDGACQIKMDSTRVSNLFKQLQTIYGSLTGGKDQQILSLKTFTRAISLLNLFKAGWSVITTQDDLVGNAIEDVVAQEYFPGANWIVKGENTVSNGAIKLEMR